MCDDGMFPVVSVARAAQWQRWAGAIVRDERVW